MSAVEIQSLREWLAHWANDPHWADATGQTVPLAKVTLAQLLDEIDKQRAGICALHDLVDLTDPNDPIGVALTKAGLERRP